jgi:hypothetical protein
VLRQLVSSTAVFVLCLVVPEFVSSAAVLVLCLTVLECLHLNIQYVYTLSSDATLTTGSCGLDGTLPRTCSYGGQCNTATNECYCGPDPANI